MKLDNPGHQLDQMIRQTRAHHVQLSTMADSKAQMLVFVSSIAIPLTMQYLNDPMLQGPAALLILFLSLTICLAAYATMPGRSRPKKIVPGDKLFNPLFFGDFQSLSYEEFLARMEGIMNDPGESYEAMLREVYGMGVYLAAHKYKYVRRGYYTFIGGVAFSMLLGWIVWFTSTDLYVNLLDVVRS